MALGRDRLMSLRPALPFLVVGFGICFLLAFLSAREGMMPGRAVVLTDGAVFRPSSARGSMVQLPEGTIVVLLGSKAKEGPRRVVLADGREGEIDSRALAGI
jgi:hypothetical protein